MRYQKSGEQSPLADAIGFVMGELGEPPPTNTGEIHKSVAVRARSEHLQLRTQQSQRDTMKMECVARYKSTEEGTLTVSEIVEGPVVDSH